MNSWLGSRLAVARVRTWTIASPRRSYISRAHLGPRPLVPVVQALTEALWGVEVRNKNREARLKKYKNPKNMKFDEMFELAIHLNLDTRKNGQTLRGTISLPSGSGKRFDCAVFTDDVELQKKALKAGAVHAGGKELMDKIKFGEVSMTQLGRCLATTQMMPLFAKTGLNRIMGPRGLMPNAKTGTLVEPEKLIEALEKNVEGQDVQYRTEKQGTVHVPVGPTRLGKEGLLANIEAVLKEIFDRKPKHFGKTSPNGKAKYLAQGGKPRYIITASLSSTQGGGFRLDPKTLDPTSPLFMQPYEEPEGAKAAFFAEHTKKLKQKVQPWMVQAWRIKPWMKEYPGDDFVAANKSKIVDGKEYWWCKRHKRFALHTTEECLVPKKRAEVESWRKEYPGDDFVAANKSKIVDGKEYWWCESHKYFVRHTNQECKATKKLAESWKKEYPGDDFVAANKSKIVDGKEYKWCTKRQCFAPHTTHAPGKKIEPWKKEYPGDDFVAANKSKIVEGKEYWWCTKHKGFARHTTQECVLSEELADL